MIEIYCVNKQQTLEVVYGTSLIELAQQLNVEMKYPVMGALVNNKIAGLSYRIHKPVEVSFFDMTVKYGVEIYKRTLYFIFNKAIRDLYPNAILNVLDEISGGDYCEIDGVDEPLSEECIQKITKRINELIDAKMPITHQYKKTKTLSESFQKEGGEIKAELYRNSIELYSSVYQLDGSVNYYYYPLLPNTEYINCFKIELYNDGLLLKTPTVENPSDVPPTIKMEKLRAVFNEFNNWNELMGVSFITDLNKLVKTGKVQDIILETELLQEKKWGKIADQIMEKNAKVILLSGPSSSGKTTSCKRLSLHLSILGYHPVPISVDDFFVERDETPRDENGDYDFEALEAIDLKLFNSVITRLLNGEEVEIPSFNFAQGTKEWKGKMLKMQKNSVLLLEGIHCLNPRLTAQVNDDLKYKIYVSPLTSLSIDKQNPIPITDIRLVRRMVRDYRYRGVSALDTLRRWKSVRAGEKKNIFPFQENADVMFNTSLLYEMAVFVPYVMPLLFQVPQEEPEFAEAMRVAQLLFHFYPIDDSLIPGTSILREFVGGSKFVY